MDFQIRMYMCVLAYNKYFIVTFTIYTPCAISINVLLILFLFDCNKLIFIISSISGENKSRSRYGQLFQCYDCYNDYICSISPNIMHVNKHLHRVVVGFWKSVRRDSRNTEIIVHIHCMSRSERTQHTNIKQTTNFNLFQTVCILYYCIFTYCVYFVNSCMRLKLNNMIKKRTFIKHRLVKGSGYDSAMLIFIWMVRKRDFLQFFKIKSWFWFSFFFCKKINSISITISFFFFVYEKPQYPSFYW